MGKGLKKTGTGLSIIFRKGVKFAKEGLGKLGKIFKKSWSSFRNKKPSPYQDETYENPEKDQYKPGYYNIVAKPKEQTIGENEGHEEYKVNYDPGVDPNKKKNKKVKKIQFGTNHNLRNRHEEKKRTKLNLMDKDILKVSSTVLNLHRNLSITNGLIKDLETILFIILIIKQNPNQKVVILFTQTRM